MITLLLSKKSSSKKNLRKGRITCKQISNVQIYQPTAKTTAVDRGSLIDIYECVLMINLNCMEQKAFFALFSQPGSQKWGWRDCVLIKASLKMSVADKAIRHFILQH